MTEIRSKQDLDRISQCVGKRRATLSKVRSIVAMWREGRSSQSCMDEIEGAIRSLDRDLNRREEAVK